MTSLFGFLTPFDLVLACAIAAMGGLVKGVVGFAMPMVLVLGLGMFLPPDWALAGLILPTVASNGLQALRQGWQAAWASVRKFSVFLSVGLIFLLSGAQLVRILPTSTLMLLIGVPVTGFALMQLIGVRLTLSPSNKRIEAAIGAFAGFIGGFSGVWGPPTVAYLTALNTPKSDQMRIQGVIYGLGAVALLAAHIGSGVMRTETFPFSLLLVAPGMLGMWVGGRLQDRIDQQTFRKVTLFVLLIAGLNLIRRGLVM